jgi:hypothetical protein
MVYDINSVKSSKDTLLKYIIIMNKYLIYILFGLILYIILNNVEYFSIGIPSCAATQ